MIIIEKSLFKFSRSIENFISTPVSFFFSFPRIFIHVYETNECHFFFYSHVSPLILVKSY